MSSRRACPFQVPRCIFDAALVMNAYILGRSHHNSISSSYTENIDLYDEVDLDSIFHVGESAQAYFVRDGIKNPTISGIPLESPLHLAPFVTMLSSISGIWGRAKTFADKISSWPTTLP
jgi:hypothetical protein